MLAQTISAEEWGEDRQGGGGCDKHQSGHDQGQEIVLDGEETPESQRWIAFGSGRPVLSKLSRSDAASPTVFSILATDIVMRTCMQTIRKIPIAAGVASVNGELLLSDPCTRYCLP